MPHGGLEVGVIANEGGRKKKKRRQGGSEDLEKSIVYPDGFQMMAEGGCQPPGPLSPEYEDLGQAYLLQLSNLALHRCVYSGLIYVTQLELWHLEGMSCRTQ